MREWAGYEGKPAVHDHVIRYLPRDYELFAGLKAGDQYPQAHRYALSLFADRLAERRSLGEMIEDDSDEYAALKATIVPPYDVENFRTSGARWSATNPRVPCSPILGRTDTATSTTTALKPDQFQFEKLRAFSPFCTPPVRAA